MTSNLANMTPAEVRALCRSGEFAGATSGAANGHVQANMMILPREFAFDFLLFCQRNPKPCPLVDVLGRGGSSPAVLRAAMCAPTCQAIAFSKTGNW